MYYTKVIPVWVAFAAPFTLWVIVPDSWNLFPDSWKSLHKFAQICTNFDHYRNNPRTWNEALARRIRKLKRVSARKIWQIQSYYFGFWIRINNNTGTGSVLMPQYDDWYETIFAFDVGERNRNLDCCCGAHGHDGTPVPWRKYSRFVVGRAGVMCKICAILNAVLCARPM